MSNNNNGIELAEQHIAFYSLIDAQLEAYRKRNIEEFASFYAAEVKGYRNGEVFFDGIDDLSEKYRAIFEQSPNLAVRILERKSRADYVFDTEEIKGLRGSSQTIIAYVAYKIREGKIVEVRITR